MSVRLPLKRLTTYFSPSSIRPSRCKALARRLTQTEEGREYVGHPHRRKSVKQKIRASLLSLSAIGAARGVRLMHLAREVNRRYGSFPAPLYTESLVCHVAKTDKHIYHRPYRKYSLK